MNTLPYLGSDSLEAGFQDTMSVEDQNDQLKMKVKELTKALDTMLKKAENKQLGND